jgi:hypothetical protein
MTGHCKDGGTMTLPMRSSTHSGKDMLKEAEF